MIRIDARENPFFRAYLTSENRAFVYAYHGPPRAAKITIIVILLLALVFLVSPLNADGPKQATTAEATAATTAPRPAPEKPPLTEEELAAIAAAPAGRKVIPTKDGIPACRILESGGTERIKITGMYRGQAKVLLEKDGYDPTKWVPLPQAEVLLEGQVRVVPTKAGRRRYACQAQTLGNSRFASADQRGMSIETPPPDARRRP